MSRGEGGVATWTSSKFIARAAMRGTTVHVHIYSSRQVTAAMRVVGLLGGSAWIEAMQTGRTYEHKLYTVQHKIVRTVSPKAMEMSHQTVIKEVCDQNT